MRDEHMGGLMAFVIAAPVMIICCGGGYIILAAVLGGLGGWLTGLGGVATVVAAFGAYLLVREFRRSRATQSGEQDDEVSCCTSPEDKEITHRKESA